MALNETDKQRVWRGFMRYLSNLRQVLANVSVTQLRTAVDETDTWIENNQANYVASLSEPFASNSTSAQKTLLFCLVASMRVGVEFARRVINQEVD